MRLYLVWGCLLVLPGFGLRDTGEGWAVQTGSHDSTSAKYEISSQRGSSNQINFPYLSPQELREDYAFEKVLLKDEWSELQAIQKSDKKQVLLRCLTNEDNPKLRFLKLNADDVLSDISMHFVHRESHACDFAQTFKGKIKGLPGANRIPTCFDGYFPNPQSNSKARSVCCSAWSYVGPDNLAKFYTKHAKDDETALMVFKQLLEALALLAGLDPPVVNRRITPWGLSVSGEDKGFALLVKDWQLVQQATLEDLCEVRVEGQNEYYGPAEDMAVDKKKCPDSGKMRFSPACGNLFQWTNEKICGSKFDVFSAGVIFMEIVYNIKSGLSYSAYSNTYSWRTLHDLHGKASRLDHDALDKIADKESAAKELAKEIGLDLTQDTPLAKAFPKMVKTLYKNPRLRPSPAELLKMDVFKDIKTPTASY